MRWLRRWIEWARTMTMPSQGRPLIIKLSRFNELWMPRDMESYRNYVGKEKVL